MRKLSAACEAPPRLILIAPARRVKVRLMELMASCGRWNASGRGSLQSAGNVNVKKDEKMIKLIE